jgi:prepilin-type processing-associated H-X9-DG protein
MNLVLEPERNRAGGTSTTASRPRRRGGAGQPAGGANFLYVDGSVHFLSYSADRVLPAPATQEGGEVVEAP